jgi:hypothetical protein
MSIKAEKKFPNLSSTNLFNFTDTIEHLKSNLYGIHCQDNLERLPQISKPMSYVVPLVSFCDIPLGVIKEHIDWYGNYAIGIKREFARTLNVCPIWYIHKNNRAYIEMHNNKTLNNSPILPYLKMFLGEQKYRDGASMKKKFYDEREWRYIPRVDSEPYIIEGSTFKEIEVIFDKDHNKIRKTKMAISAHTIEYIIVSEEHEKEQLYPILKELAIKENISYESLVSTLLTCKQIRNDF